MSQTPRTEAKCRELSLLPHSFGRQRRKAYLALARELEREKAEIEREFNALNKKFSMILTDENYVGGVRYWVAKHDRLLIEYQNLLTDQTRESTTPPAPPPPTD